MLNDALRRRDSLSWRLPLVISASMAVVIAVFMWAAYGEVHATLWQAGAERARNATNEVAGLLAQASRRSQDEIQLAAANPGLGQYLQHRTDDTESAARSALAALVRSGPRRIEVWTEGGALVLDISTRPPAGGSSAIVIPTGVRPSAAGVSPLYMSGNLVIADAVAEIREPPPLSARLGYLVVRSTLIVSPPGILNRLVGGNAFVEVGNKAGDVWTDLSKRVPSPAVDLKRQHGAAEYAAAGGQVRIGALAEIPGTPWAVSVDFPRAFVLAPVRSFLLRMGAIAIVLIGLAAAVARWLTIRITAPLSYLAGAAQAVAGGDYSERVTLTRPDEIGRVGAAFNLMSDQVQAVLARLELRAAELAASRESAYQQQAIWESVLQRMRDGVMVCDGHGKLLLFNRAAEQMCGISPGEAGLDTWTRNYSIFRPDGTTLFDPEELPLKRATLGYSSDDVQLLIRHPKRDDGVLLNTYARPLANKAGTITGGMVILEDITERHRIEAALRDRERDFRTLFADSPLAMWVYDLTTLQFLEVNGTAVRQYGYSRDEFLAMRLTDIRPPEDVPVLLTNLAEARNEWETSPNWRHRLKSGRIIDVEIVSHRLVFDNRQAAMVVAHDVTERRRMERALIESEARKTAVVEGALDCIVTMDHDGLVIEFNPAAESTFGYTRAEAIGRELADLVIPASLRARHREGLARYVATGTGAVIGKRLELPAVRKNGEEFAAEVSIVPIQRHGPPMFTGFIRDLTEQKAAERARMRALRLEEENRRVQEASRLKSEFLANMSHELRTPLNAIIGFSELLHDGEVRPETPEFKDFLGYIHTSGQHLLQLINDILDLSKVEAGRLEFHPEELDVKHTIAEVLGILGAAASEKQLVIKYDVDSTVGQLLIDGGRLKQVLYNYLSNAIKFTSEGGRIRVTVKPEGADTFRLEVEDSGIGIAPEDIERLFIEFGQLEAGAAKTHQGTGLGLALTKRLVQAQGGDVGVRSTPGVGSVFFAVLPRRATGGTPLAEPQSYPAARLDAPSVLVVEDNQRDQETLVGMLTSAGFAVETASTAAQALIKIETLAFDAITLDMLLPDASGVDILRKIRSGGRNSDVPVIVITVVAADGAVNGFAVQDILPKPVDGDELLAALTRAGISSERQGTVLVVDDDPGSLRLMAASLGQLGYQCTCVAQAAEALRLAERAAPLAVVLDLLMPEMDGFQFLERFRRMPHCRRTPVIVWTVKDLSREEHERLRSSVQGVMSKGQNGSASVVDELRRFVAPRGAV